jgi:glycosyltransferase involved in cell wall biosynthesis
MKIGIIADSPLLTTGFGIESYQVASVLTESGHKVVCFGLKGSRSDEYAASQLPFRIWHIDIATHWDITLRDFFQEEDPDLVIILIDLFNLRELMQNCIAASWHGTTLVYLTPDGIPAYNEYLEPLKYTQKRVVTTHTCAKYLENCGIHIDAIAPAGVDAQLFKPLTTRDELRKRAGLRNKFVVGVFGRNYERKQQYRVMEALAKIHQVARDENVVAYFHCQKRGYWYLDEIAAELGIQNHVFFPEKLPDEARGVASSGNGFSELDKVNTVNSQDKRPQMPDHYSYVERINCCDIIVNVSHCGDFEHIIIEAQSCGVPLAHTDDEGIMAEAMGLGGLKLKAVDVSRGRIGQKIFLVSPDLIADAILSVKYDSSLRNKLRELGIENARQYPWTKLRNTMVSLVGKI